MSFKNSIFARFLPLLSALFLAPLAACNAEPANEAANMSQPASEEKLANSNNSCGANGRLAMRLFGSIETNILWSGSEMLCESMQRPNNEGVRLRMAGDIGTERFAVIIALPELNRETIGAELSTNITATVEGSGRFFSTPNMDSCWTDIDAQSDIDEDLSEVSATLYCVAPLGEINGDGTVSIDELTFTTTVNWNQ